MECVQQRVLKKFVIQVFFPTDDGKDYNLKIVANALHLTKRLADGGEIEFRPPGTAADNCNIAENLFISSMLFVQPELKLNIEQKVDC